MIESKLAKADPIRERLVKGAIQNVIRQLTEVDDLQICNAKDPQIFVKIKLEIPNKCERCGKEYKNHSIVDKYDFNKNGNLKVQTTEVICNKCSKKV